MSKYIAVVESWGDATNWIDFISNRLFEVVPIEMVFDFKNTLWVNSVENMVDSVLAASSGSVDWLVILGHGFAGWQSVGCGKDLDPTDTKHLSVAGATGKLAGDAEKHLKRLQPVLSGNSVVSLMGCETGKGTDGELLLQTVSAALGGVPVEAGIEMQRALAGFEGDVRRCAGKVCTIQPASFFQ